MSTLLRLILTFAFVALAFQNRLEYRNAEKRVNSRSGLATLCENLVNFRPVTPEFTRVVGVFSLVDQQWS